MPENNIKALRLERGETQQQLADALGVTWPLVSMWETGARTPSVGNLLRLCSHFGCSADRVLGREAANV